MWLKLLIIINFIVLVVVLFSGLFFVYNEKGKGRKTLYTLSLRVGLAISLMTFLGYGIATGQVGHSAPWDKNNTAQQ